MNISYLRKGMMPRTPQIIAFAVLCCIVLFSRCSGPGNPVRPNIILIMADDMGYSDLGCYGGEIRTPNLDRLAEDGIRFTQFYNAARCCPTRASLMTGLYPHQTGIGHMTNYPGDSLAHDYGLPGYRGYLNRNCVTIAEVLQQAGYTTLMTGKWHLGYFGKEKWPLQRGFDRFYGIIPGACNYFHPAYPRGITYGNDTISIRDDDFYTTDAFTDSAIQFISESVGKESGSDGKPFFLYLAYNAPHWPLNAPPEDIERYRGKYMDGWQAARLRRYERMIEMGLVDQEWELTPQDSREWDTMNGEKKREMDLRMAIYAAMIDRMDQNIGRLVAFLEKEAILDNTLIMFLSDNGACAEFAELGSGPAEQLGTEQGYVLSYGRAWANASNTPYRKYKHWVHEGGISTPLIIHWPGVMPQKERGILVDEYGFLPDIMATCLDAAGATYPLEYGEHPIHPLAGKSLLPMVRGNNGPIHTEPIFFEHEGNKAVRMGKYKLVEYWDGDTEGKWELYDMEADRTEMNDLAGIMPEKVEEMRALYQEWAAANMVRPWDEILRIIRKKQESGQQ
jgi:arylsulfatase A-like enzyme